MALDNSTHINASFLLKVVDVLSHVFPKHALILKHFDKVVSRRWIILRQVEVLGELVERLWVVNEVGERE